MIDIIILYYITVVYVLLLLLYVYFHYSIVFITIFHPLKCSWSCVVFVDVFYVYDFFYYFTEKSSTQKSSAVQLLGALCFSYNLAGFFFNQEHCF